MNKNIMFIVLLLAFVANDNVLEDIGYHIRDFSSPLIFRLHPLTYLAFFFVIYYLIIGKLKVSNIVHRMKSESIYLIVCFVTICYLQMTDNLNAIAFFLNALILPVLISILLKTTDKKVVHRFHSWFYAFFFLNALIAIIEKLRGSFLLNHSTEFQFDYFRSSALYGHPLNNGLIMSVLTIILFMATKNSWLKLMVLLTGTVSTFCFGARGALIGIFIGIVLNFVINATGFGLNKRKKNVGNGLIYLTTFVVTIFLVVSYTGLGDRIAALSHVDDSAEARLSSIDVIKGIKLHDLLWGIGSADKIDNLQYMSGVEIIENFYIIWILRFGLIITVLLISALMNFLFGMMRNVTSDIKIPILFTFIFVASTNNSLATSTIVISILVLAYYGLFDSQNKLQQFLIDEKI